MQIFPSIQSNMQKKHHFHWLVLHCTFLFILFIALPAQAQLVDQKTHSILFTAPTVQDETDKNVLSNEQKTANPATNQVTAPATSPIINQATSSVANQATSSVANQVTNSIIKQVTSPVIKPVTNPVTKPAASPDTNQAIQAERSDHKNTFLNIPQQTATPVHDPLFSSIFTTATYLCIILAFIFLVYWLLRKFGPRGISGGRSMIDMRLAGRLVLGQKQRIDLVRVQDKMFLLGVTDHTLVLLKELEPMPGQCFDDGNEDEFTDFTEMLGKQIRSSSTADDA